MTHLLQLIEQYGLLLVFANVFLEQLGAPLPAYPTLIITGALAYRGEYSVALLLTTAVGAALVADFAWFLLGRRYGRRVLSTLCRISLSPDSCVRQTETVYTRYGAPSLLIAKFIPGFASVASALAGAIGTSAPIFLIYDGLGAALWAGLGVYLGALFSDGVDNLLNILQELGEGGLLLLCAGFLIFIARKWWQRRRFMATLRMARISVDELHQMFEQGLAPTVVDVRSQLSQRDGRIPGAYPVFMKDLATFALDAATDSEIIVYCACPNEASAAQVAKELMQRGYSKVRPLQGGIDAWVAAGHTIDTN
ncbi:MAG: Alkaline phosphatase like protein [Herbaspirillum sp.]|jgi:membrane protein DedA with SNARE-associated domain/rhodanese-related sulfurtransferase|nr:Alkaline phosphatase like protein [Herbaspirillum sp.]